MKIVPMKLNLLRLGLPWLVAATTSVAVLLAAQPVAAQSLMDGYWSLTLDEDAYPYAGGPDPQDFSGLPITAAARVVAQQYDPEEQALPALQCRPFPGTYGPRSLSTMRVWETLDPQTQQQTKIETWILIMSEHRVIWMPPSHHPSPPPSAPHTWQGYSTGKWVGNVLWVHTDHLKAALLQRVDGLPLDDQTTMDERITRYGDNVLLDIMMFSDPQYLSEPMIYSKLYYRLPQGVMDPFPCTPSNEISLPKGLVPMHLPFYTVDYNDHFLSTGIPLEAAAGGAQTMYPEYQDHLKTLPLNPPSSQIMATEAKQRAQQAVFERQAGEGN